jgi:hypothetical protein
MRESELSQRLPRDSRIRFVFDAETERKESADFSALVVGKERLLVQDDELRS